MPHAKFISPENVYVIKLKLYVLYDECRIRIYQLMEVEICLLDMLKGLSVSLGFEMISIIGGNMFFNCNIYFNG